MYHVFIIIINFEEDSIIIINCEDNINGSSPELEMELELKWPELELKLIVSSGIGIENNGIEIEMKKMELTPTLSMTHITITTVGLVLHDIKLQRVPLQLDEQYSVEYYRCYKMIIANEILKPLNWLTLIDCVQTTYDIEPGFHYFNNVNISSM